jgi:hypothetical protein
VTHPGPIQPIRRRAAKLLLAAIMAVTLSRIAYLATVNPKEPVILAGTPSAPGSAGGSANDSRIYQAQTPGEAGGYQTTADANASTKYSFPSSQPLAASPQSPVPIPDPRASRDAELADLYRACPLAAVIDLETVATHPEKIDAILPPYRETAAHVPNSPTEPAVPRIR